MLNYSRVLKIKILKRTVKKSRKRVDNVRHVGKISNETLFLLILLSFSPTLL